MLRYFAYVIFYGPCNCYTQITKNTYPKYLIL